MPHVDSLLQLAHREGANELRLGTDRSPAMFATGAPKRLAIPKTSADTLKHLLGDLITPEVDAQLRTTRRAGVKHQVPGLGTFAVRLNLREGEEGAIDAVFLLEGSTATPRAEPAPVVAPFVADAAKPREGSVQPNDQLMDLLRRAQGSRGSDLHFAHGEPPIVRIDGALSVLGDEGPVDTETLVGALLDAPSRDRLEEGRSADFALELPPRSTPGYRGDALPGGRGARVRGNVYKTSRGLAAAFRLLPPEAPSLDTIVQPVPLADIAHLPNGLVIVCGPTGSGKSTTLASLAQEALKTRSILLVTLEDPIEYALTPCASTGGRGRSLVRQRQIGRDARDFATGLRDALREDPDVILVGEMRDAESISLALTAAETGHLVLTTLHSRSAASAIERIVDVYPEGRQGQIRSQLADSLRAVIAQRLLPRTSGDGRTLALEVLRVNPSVANGLREGKIANVTSAMQSGKRDGMITLERSLADLVRRGEISLEVARAAANDREGLASYLQGAG